MHNIQWQIDSVCDGDDTVSGLTFNLIRAGKRVAFGSENALLYESILVVLD
jgi:hypothetical protein